MPMFGMIEHSLCSSLYEAAVKTGRTKWTEFIDDYYSPTKSRVLKKKLVWDV